MDVYATSAVASGTYAWRSPGSTVSANPWGGSEHDAAVICVARRCHNIILAMLKPKPPYQPAKLPDAA